VDEQAAGAGAPAAEVEERVWPPRKSRVAAAAVAAVEPVRTEYDGDYMLTDEELGGRADLGKIQGDVLAKYGYDQSFGIKSEPEQLQPTRVWKRPPPEEREAEKQRKREERREKRERREEAKADLPESVDALFDALTNLFAVTFKANVGQVPWGMLSFFGLPFFVHSPDLSPCSPLFLFLFTKACVDTTSPYTLPAEACRQLSKDLNEEARKGNAGGVAYCSTKQKKVGLSFNFKFYGVNYLWLRLFLFYFSVGVLIEKLNFSEINFCQGVLRVSG
jgi:hypothetical protein